MSRPVTTSLLALTGAPHAPAQQPWPRPLHGAAASVHRGDSRTRRASAPAERAASRPLAWVGACLRRLRLALFALLMLLAAGVASAHQASDAYLRLQADAQGRLAVQAEVALRDLDTVLDLDADGDGRLRWGEVRTRRADIEALVIQHLRFARADGQACPLSPRNLAVDRKADGGYVVLALGSDCRRDAVATLDYTLFAGVDPTHRGLLLVAQADGSTAPLRSLVPGAPPAMLDDGARAGGGFFADGLHHILIGADHVLFLVCLLLPLALAPAVRGGRAGASPGPQHRARIGSKALLGWDRSEPAPLGGGESVGRPGASLSARVLPLVGLVTAFTVAHSITLALAAWRVVSVPPSVIEPLIALTIAVAAADNLWPVLGRRRAWAAFAFGLIHGFGFAGPLTELDLPPLAMAKALLQFNLGVEAGQLLVVLVAFALLSPLRGRDAAQAGLRYGSLAAGLVALVWLGERVLDFKVLPL